MSDFTRFHAKDFTGVRHIKPDPVQPFTVRVIEARGERIVGRVRNKAVAEAIARGHRIDHRGTRTRVNEHRPVGVAYIAV